MSAFGTPYPVGKLPASVLADLLQRHGPRSRRVLTGPAIGEDAAAVLTSLPCMVAASDPVTCATDRIGWYVVHVNANDVATRGAEPVWFLLTLLLAPHEATPERVEDIFAQAYAACGEVGVELIGGHTEITADLPRTIAIGTMLGETTTFRLTATGGARTGDAVVQAGAVAVEGTVILAREHVDLLRRRGVPESVVERARTFLDGPGISVVPYCRYAMRVARPHAMHDATEGGLATTLHELGRASGSGMEIDARQVLVLDETRAICGALGLDPWGLLASGTVVVCCPEDDVAPLLAAYRAAGVAAARIGTITPREAGVVRRDAEGARQPVPTFLRDELMRVL